MQKDETINHLIQKGNILEKTRPKLPYGHGRGELSSETEFRKEYQPKDGAAADELRHPDHVNFGKNRFFDTTTGKHYKDTKGDPLAKGDFEKNKSLEGEIATNSKQGHTLLNKEEHANKYQAPKDQGDNNPKPDKWMKGKNEKVNLEFNNHTTNKDNFPGHHEGYAEKQKEHFDNLKSPNNLGVESKTKYREQHAGKSPDVRADKELFGHNQEKGKAGHKFLENPDAKKKTEYEKQFNDTLKADGIQDKPHYGKDDKTKDFLYQYHKGYYHTDDQKK